MASVGQATATPASTITAIECRRVGSLCVNTSTSVGLSGSKVLRVNTTGYSRASATRCQIVSLTGSSITWSTTLRGSNATSYSWNRVVMITTSSDLHYL